MTGGKVESMKNYTIEYKEYKAAGEKSITVLAPNKRAAYYKGYRMVNELLGSDPYSLWVAAVTYQNGNYKEFNTFEGKPY